MIDNEQVKKELVFMSKRRRGRGDNADRENHTPEPK